MRKLFLVLLFGAQFANLPAWAVNLIPNDPTGISLNGAYYDYYRIRFSSLSGESGADANLFGDSLKISFGGGSYGGATSGSGLKFDFATSNIGLVIQSEYPSAVIHDLRISASGTYSLFSSSLIPGSFAQVIAQIPFNLQVVGVNGVPYSSADLVRGYNLQVLPSDVMIVPTGSKSIDSGSWTATWSIQGLGSSLAQIFNIPSMKITALDVAITPDLTSISKDGSSSIYLNYVDFTPIPEPTSLSLLAVGGAWLVFSRRRKS